MEELLSVGYTFVRLMTAGLRFVLTSSLLTLSLPELNLG